MRALQSFHHESPGNFGAWFRTMLVDRPLPWSWDHEDAALLLRWFHHFHWGRHLVDEAPTKSGAASVIAVLLSQAYQHCFAGDGDTAVWKRLGQTMGIPETSFGANASRIARVLGIYQDCAAESELIHVIPFLKLVGCPQQALPSLGQQLRSSVPLRKRYRALVTAQWGADAEVQLKAWMRDGRVTPTFLSPAEAELIQREPEAKKDDQGFLWRVLELTNGAFQPVLLPIDSITGGDWTGTAGQVNAETARTFGIPQEVGRDGLVQGGGQTLDVAWPNTPTFWNELKPAPRGVRRVFQRSKSGSASLVCLPPKWSLDGDGEPEWRWVAVDGFCTLFDPFGTPWQHREDSPTWDALQGICIEGHPHIAILHELPSGLPKLEIRGGLLGSTLQEDVTWEDDGLGVPPLGHLVLSWTTRKGARRNKEIYCLPTLQLTMSFGEQAKVWIRGMEGLIGKEEGQRYYELDIQAHGNTWTSLVPFRGWGQNSIQLRLKGALNPYGAVLYGWRSHHPWASHGPWHVGPNFPMSVYEANLRFELALPPAAESRLWVDNTVPLWPEKALRHQRRLGPLEFHEPLRPLWDVIEPMGRPLRLTLAWANPVNPEDERLRSTLMARIFPRDAKYSVQVLSDRVLRIRTKDNNAYMDQHQLTVQVGSAKLPDALIRVPLSEFAAKNLGNGIEITLPELDPTKGPYFLGIRSNEDDTHPISIHIDGRGNPIQRSLDAHAKAVRGRMIGGIHPSDDARDYRDQLLSFAYDLAETHDLTDFFEHEEIKHWLDFLGDDFLFSQPWTLGIALRHPRLALEHIISAPWTEAKKSQALGNLGQSGWTWWLVSPSDIGSMAWEQRALLLTLTSRLARQRITALHRISNPGVRNVAVARLCEEGLFLALEAPARRLFLQQMGFPVDLMDKPWRPKDLAARMLQQQDSFLVDQIALLIEPSPEPAPVLPKPPTNGLPGLPEMFERLTRLSGWGRAYGHWVNERRGSLICAPSWSKATPEVFRHYGPLFAFFALLRWQD